MERMSEDEVKEEAGESNKLPNQHFFHYSEHTRPYEEVCFLLFFNNYGPVYPINRKKYVILFHYPYNLTPPYNFLMILVYGRY